MITRTTAQRALARLLAGLALALPLWGAQAQTARPAYGLIVKLKDAPSHESLQALAQGTTQQRLQQVLAAAGVTPSRLRPVGRAAQRLDFGRVLGGAEAATLAAKLRERPEVAWAVPNERERRLQLVPDDPCYPNTPGSNCPWSTGQWWLHPVSGSNANVLKDRLRGVPGVQSAWAIEFGRWRAVIAVLDTGITAHPDLDAHVLPGYDFVSTVEYANDGTGRDADPSDPGDWVTQAEKSSNPLFADCEVANSSWHGTDIAGIVAAVTDNALGVAGVNRDGRVLPVRVAGKCGADVADIVDGMRWAAGLNVVGVPANPNPARILNISFGGDAPCNEAYQDAIDEIAAQKGAVVVAAAGNEHGNVTRPASCSGVVAVTALNRDGFKATYANFGPQVTVATVGGDYPGDGAWGALLGDDGLLTLDNSGLQGPASPTYSRLFGTSFAAPVAAGVVSLMLSANDQLTAAQIIAGVKLSARPHVTSPKIGLCSAQNPGRCLCTTTTCGAGILDAEEALRYALNPTGYAVPARIAAVIDNPDVDAAVALGNDLPPNPGSGGGGSSGGGGGGALGVAWLLGLALALGALAKRR
ncbi:S8 family peptidase [Piscinibacter sp.]|uniref:S8 family peptidase n=1 Tax=Piscinibacter sp. TaxID=1903157 RepID=UPI002F41F8B6